MRCKKNTENRGIAKTMVAAAAFGAFFLGASPEQFLNNGAPIPTAFTI